MHALMHVSAYVLTHLRGSGPGGGGLEVRELERTRRLELHAHLNMTWQDMAEMVDLEYNRME